MDEISKGAQPIISSAASSKTAAQTARARRATHAVAEYALLGLLREGPRHGYALAEVFAPGGLLADVLRLGTSQMYAYLHKLERQGWLQATEEGVGHSERTRRVFRLTPAGAQAFDVWIAAPVAATREIRLDFLLKLTFALAQDRAQARTLLERQREATAAWLARLSTRHMDDTTPAPLSPAPDETNAGREGKAQGTMSETIHALVLRHRVRQSEATLAWLDEALAALPH